MPRYRLPYRFRLPHYDFPGSRPSVQDTVFMWCGILLLLLTLLAGRGMAFSPVGTGGGGSGRNTGDAWHITADQIEYSQAEDQYIAEGDVVLINKDQKINADYVRYDKKNKKAYALGDVVLTAGEDVLLAQRMTIDLEKRTGIAYQGTVFIKEGHYRIWGDRIQKTGENTYIAENAVVTTCDGDKPDWKVSGSEAEVTIEGYGTVTNATLWTKKIPVAYSPFIFFPAKHKRQSGFLAPRFSFSDRLGTEYEQPYFWAIDEQQDATIYWDHLGERGEKIGTEYRYVVDSYSSGAIMFDFLKDDKIDDGTDDSSTMWGYDDDRAIRPNSKRYWFRMKNTQRLPSQFTGKLDLDVVSDQDYLTEFRDGYSGFDETAGYFENTFGRGLDDYTDTTRTNTLIIGKSWDRYSLSMEGRWTDDLLRRQGREYVDGAATPEESIQPLYETDNTVQRLPLIQFNGSKQEAWDEAWLYWSFDTQAAFFYRIDGVRGERADLYPRFYVPMRYNNYFSFEPSIGVRETLWYVNDYNGGTLDAYDNTDSLESTFNREIYDIKLDLSSEVYRVYSPGWSIAERFRHAIVPQVVYSYRPDWDQSEYPVFDSVDRLGGAHVVTYSVVNTFTSRTQVVKPGTEGNEEPPRYTYNEFCRFSLAQSYNINNRNAVDPKPFSAITGTLDFSLWRYFSLETDAAWNPYQNRLTKRNIGVGLSDYRGDVVNFEYRVNRNSTESLNISASLVITDYLSLYFNIDRDLIEKKYIETRGSLLYKTGCWSLDLGVSKDDEAMKYTLMVNLYGLGGFGSSVRPDTENN